MEIKKKSWKKPKTKDRKLQVVSGSSRVKYNYAINSMSLANLV